MLWSVQAAAISGLPDPLLAIKLLAYIRGDGSSLVSTVSVFVLTYPLREAHQTSRERPSWSALGRSDKSAVPPFCVKWTERAEQRCA
jgi:hypothetical protein